MANVRVLVRVRPLSQKEKSGRESVIVQINDEFKTVAVTNVKVPDNAEYDSREKERLFAFQECFDCDTPQETIFEKVGVEVLNVALKGFNACVLAYGQSGTGKTFTMMGDEDSPGLTPRMCRAVFPRLAETSSSHERPPLRIAVSYLEIHNERVRDLLKTKSSTPLKVREHPKKGTYVEGLSEVGVSDACTLTGLLAEGNSRRCTARLGDHSHSSRSHAVFTLALQVPGRQHPFSKFHLVDLAGSEKAGSGGSRKRKEEGASINKSLVTLGNVISALECTALFTRKHSIKDPGTFSMHVVIADICIGIQRLVSASTPTEKSRNSKRRCHIFIPYRDSVLTWLLRDSLGGNAHTFMIATVSPANGSYSETVNTLRYAQRAKHIINKPRMSAHPDDSSKTIQELRAEVAKLKTALAKFQMNGAVKPIRQILPCTSASSIAKRWISRYSRHISGLQPHSCPQSYLTSLHFIMGQGGSSGCEATPPATTPSTEEAVEVVEAHPCTLLPVMLLDHVSPVDLRLSSSCDLVYRSPSRKINRSQHRHYSSQDSLPPDPGLSPENSIASSSSSLESNRSLDGRMGSLIGASNIYRNRKSGIPVRVRSASSPDLSAKQKKRSNKDIVADVTKRLYPVKKTKDPAAAVTAEAETCSRAANRLRELSKRLVEAHRKALGKVEVETQTEREKCTKEAAVGTEARVLTPTSVLLMHHGCELISGVQPDLLNQCRSCEKLSDECFSDDSLDNVLQQSVETDSLDDALDETPKRRNRTPRTDSSSSQGGGWEIKLEVSSDDGGVVKVTHSSDDSRPLSSDDNNSCPSPLSSEGGSFGSDSSGDDILYFMQSPQPPEMVPQESPPNNRYERSLYTILESSEHSDQSDCNANSPTAFVRRSRSVSPKSKNVLIQIDENKNVQASGSTPTCSITIQDRNCNPVAEPVREVIFEGEFTIRPKFAMGNSILTQNKPTVCYPNDSARLISNSFYPEFTRGLEETIQKSSSIYTSPHNFNTETTNSASFERGASPGQIPAAESQTSGGAEKNAELDAASSPPAAFKEPVNFFSVSAPPTRPQEIRPAEDLTDTSSRIHNDKSHANQYSNEEEVYEIKKAADARDLSADSLVSRENMAQLPGSKEQRSQPPPPVQAEQVSVPWADPVQRKFLNINVTTPTRGPNILQRDSSFNSDDSFTFVYLGPNRKNAPPVLLELVQRASKGLQRSISLDSATRALGKFSKQSNKNNNNRAYSVENVNPEETRSFLEPVADAEGPNHNFKRLRREALTPSDSEVRSTDDDFEDSPPPELPKTTGSDTNQNWAEMKSLILGHQQQMRQASSSPSPPPVPPRRRGSGKKAVSWSDVSGCGLISSPSTHSLPSPVNSSPKPIIKKTTLPPVPQSRSPSPGTSFRRDRMRLDLQNLHRPLRERSVSAPRLSHSSPWCSPYEDSSPSPEADGRRRETFSRSPPRCCGSPRCRSVGDVTQVGVEQEPIRQFLAQATDLLHSLSDLSRQIEQQIPPPSPTSRFEPLDEIPELSSSYSPAPCHHCGSAGAQPPRPPSRSSYYEPSPLERQLEASCARLEASLSSQPRWQELCEQPVRPQRRSGRPRWQLPQPLPPLPPHQHRQQFSPRAYMRYLLGVRKRIIQSAQQEDQVRRRDEDYL